MSETDDIRTLLDDWKALEAAATPGPWWWNQRGDLRPTPHEYRLDSIIGWDAIVENPVLSDGDAAFIAASRTLVPRLIAAVEAVLHLERTPDADEWDWGYNTALDNVEDLIRSALIGGDDE